SSLVSTLELYWARSALAYANGPRIIGEDDSFGHSFSPDGGADADAGRLAVPGWAALRFWRAGRLAAVPRPGRAGPLLRPWSPPALEREGERSLEDGDSRPGLVVAGDRRRPGVADDRNGRRPFAARHLRRCR